MIKHVSALVISMENGLGCETFEGKDKMEVLIRHLAFDEWPPAGKYQIVAILKHFSVKIIKIPVANDLIFIPNDGTAAERFISRGCPLFQLK